MRRQRGLASKQRARDRSRSITVSVICVGFAMTVIGTAIYYDWLPTSLRSSTMAQSSDDRMFAETRTGQVRTHVKGNTCQELQFSNVTGSYVGGSFVPCKAEPKPGEAPSPQAKGSRINSIRDAFLSR